MLPSLSYLDWNNKIAEYFFNPESSGKRIWFFVERELIEEIAQSNETDFNSFIESLKKGPEWITRHNQGICIKAHQTFENWDREKLKYPPYIAYLALFVIAANPGNEEELSENSYYKRLRELLNEQKNGNQNYPSFNKMCELWDDLEKWSLQDKKSEWGEFHADICGSHFHVGITYYQVVLTKKDEEKLPQIFSKKGWDSDSDPTDLEIIDALKTHHALLEGKTQRRINNNKPDFISILCQRVREDLKFYEYEDSFDDNQEKEESTKQGTIVLCLEVDTTAGTAKPSFRLKRNKGLPEEEFPLRSENSKNGQHECRVKPSTSTISGKIENIDIDWKKDFSLISLNQEELETDTMEVKWIFNYRVEKCKLFMPGEEFGVRGFVSIPGKRVDPNTLFYMAVQKNMKDKIQKWGDKSCEVFEELSINDLPGGWFLFKVSGIKNCQAVKTDIPALSTDEKPRIKLEGGIRLSRGNRFSDFAPPKISIIGGNQSFSEMTCSVKNEDCSEEEGKEFPLIPLKNKNNLFFLPENIPVGKQITINIPNTDNNRGVSSKFICCENHLKTFDCYIQKPVNSFGIFKSEDQEILTGSENRTDSDTEVSLQGAYGVNLTKTIYPKLPDLSVKPREKTYLLGDIPGQIISWPDEPLPEWTPLWGVQFKIRKKGEVSLLGCVETSSEDINQQDYTRKEKKKWKEIIWHKRKHLTCKGTSSKKWKKFIEKARKSA